MSYSKQELQIITSVYCLFRDNLTCTENWGFYLFDEEFHCEQELRNKLGIIWLASLFDSIHAEIRQINLYKAQAEQLGLIHIPRYCDQALEFFQSIKDIILKYTKQEQVFIVHLRNQWVHSFLKGRHNESIGIKYIEDNEFKKESIPRDEFEDLVHPIFERGNLDETLEELVGRFLGQEAHYWQILGEIQRNQHEMYAAMKQGHEFQFTAISA